MNAEALVVRRPTVSSPVLPHVDAVVDRVAATPRAASRLDLDGARAHVENHALGVVPLWFLDAKPRRSAVILPASHRAWRDGRLGPAIEAHVAGLRDAGVAVVVVDTRRPFGLRWLVAAGARLLGAWRRSNDDAYVRTAAYYLEARGYCPENIEVGRVG